jgi:YegS/Rv2252/BmrU family lipid kinase
MKPLLIVNPAAGQGKPESNLDAVMAAFGRLDPVLVMTETRGDAERAAEEAGLSRECDCVVVAGGDGTINEAVNGLMASVRKGGAGLPLGIVPFGTQNVLSHELGLPVNNLEGLAAIVAAGKTRKIDIGIVNGRYFTLMAGFGFDAVVVRDVHRPTKELIGPAAYAFATIAAITKYRSTAMRLVLDGERINTDAFLLVVANAASYAYRQVKMAPFASIDDGWLDICVFERPPTDRIGFATQVLMLFAGRHLRDPRVRYYRARTIEIDSTPPVDGQLDGDPQRVTPVSIAVVPSALTVFVP